MLFSLCFVSVSVYCSRWFVLCKPQLGARAGVVPPVPDSPDVLFTSDVPDLVDRCSQHADVPRVATVRLPHCRGCLVGVSGGVCCDDLHSFSLWFVLVSVYCSRWPVPCKPQSDDGAVGAVVKHLLSTVGHRNRPRPPRVAGRVAGAILALALAPRRCVLLLCLGCHLVSSRRSLVVAFHACIILYISAFCKPQHHHIGPKKLHFAKIVVTHCSVST